MYDRSEVPTSSDLVPRTLRKALGYPKRYLQRLARWAIILVQVRGASWSDELKLLVSAAASPMTSLADLRGWQDPVLLFDAHVRVGGIGTFMVRRRTDDLWHVLPWRERGIHRALRQMLGPGDLFVDAGANIGIYTVLASRLVGPKGRVLAIEMMPDTAAILRRHVTENACENVEIVERALSDRTGEVITARVPVGKYGQASIAEQTATEGFKEHQVIAVTLDDACRDLARIRLMKLDLEGAELQALAGGHSVLERTNTVIYESHTHNDALAEQFRRAGFDQIRTSNKDRIAERGARSIPNDQ